ncbi:MAG: hypothetical protein ACK4HV_05500, partial [Parachlamydiaceae bacterium]
MEPILFKKAVFSFSYEKCIDDPSLIIFESLTDQSFFSRLRINLKAKSITVFSPFQAELQFLLINQEIAGEFIGSAAKVSAPPDVQKLAHLLLNTNAFTLKWHLVLQILATVGIFAINKN